MNQISSTKKIVKDASKDLSLNESKSIVCPFCVEDWNRMNKPKEWKPEKSMSITRAENGILYNCFRASCGAKGFIPSVYTGAFKVKKKPRVYNYEVFNLGSHHLQFLVDKFDLTIFEIENNRIQYNPERSSYVLPIFNYVGNKIGVVDRSWLGRKPKAITYWENIDEYKIHFPIGWDKNNGKIYLVEDQISAIKLSRYKSVAALLGSHLSWECADFLRTLTGNIVLALDNDALSKSLELRKKYLPMFDSIEILFLEKDPKDMNNEELRNL